MASEGSVLSLEWLNCSDGYCRLVLKYVCWCLPQVLAWIFALVAHGNEILVRCYTNYLVFIFVCLHGFHLTEVVQMLGRLVVEKMDPCR